VPRSRYFGERNFVDSPKGRLLQFRKRQRARLLLLIDDIEPKSKGAMSDTAKVRLQKKILDRLVLYRRQAFREPIALQLHFETTEKNPAHIHTIAKNLLDLFGKPLPALKSKRKGLIYSDDRKIHALSVSCRHGQEHPRVVVQAMPLSNLLEDINLAHERSRTREETWAPKEVSGEDALERFTEHLRDKNKGLYPGDTYQRLLQMYRRDAQDYLLGRVRVSLWELVQLYDQRSRRFGFSVSGAWENIFRQAPFRIMLDELPLRDGQSAPYKAQVKAQLSAFKENFSTLLDPLLVPVGLEIVVKPSPDDRRSVEHDLDNVARDYMIPAAVEVLSPTSDMAFFFREDEFVNPLKDDHTIYRKPPKTTRTGVARYEVWRLPPAQKGETGFVGLAVVADPDLRQDLFEQIDSDIEEWAEESINGEPRSFRSRPRGRRRLRR
jgi:hypothetical protein